MNAELCDKPEAATSVARRAPVSTVAGFLRERGDFPPVIDDTGRMVDMSPLARLTPLQRRRRLVAILEYLAMHGDGAAAGEALRHARWEQEMKTGKAPQRLDVNNTGEIKVIDDLRSPGDTPIPIRSRLRPA